MKIYPLFILLSNNCKEKQPSFFNVYQKNIFSYKFKIYCIGSVIFMIEKQTNSSFKMFPVQLQNSEPD